MDDIEIFKAIQRLARTLQAVRLPLDRLIELAFHNTGITPDKAAIGHVLRTVNAQREFAHNWETILYRHINNQFVLICAALPDNPKDAMALTQRRLINSREACSFCGLIEGGYAPLELVTAIDPVGQLIQGERVHPRCQLPWQRLKLIAARSPAKPTKESLL